MSKGWRRMGIAVAAACLVLAGAPAASADEEGFFLFLDGILGSTQDADHVVGTTVDTTTLGFQTNRDVVEWGDSTNTRFGLGYAWESGSQLTVSFWTFDNDERGSRNVSSHDGFYTSFGYYIPTYYYSGSYSGYTISLFAGVDQVSFDSSVEASSVDVEWGRSSDLGDEWSLEWSLGLRFASFEESFAATSRYTYSYSYSGPSYSGSMSYSYFLVERSQNESDMWGFSAGVRGTFDVTDTFGVTGGIRVSKVRGDVDSIRSQVLFDPGGTAIFASRMAAADDDRSGTLWDYDVAAVWRLSEDRWRISLGYEHSTWDGITADLLRQQVGLADRRRMSFSGWKLGVRLRF